MQPFGTYNDNRDHVYLHYDVGDVQTFLPKGHRIRNKKAKRRTHNKVTRQRAKEELRKENY